LDLSSKTKSFFPDKNFHNGGVDAYWESKYTFRLVAQDTFRAIFPEKVSTALVLITEAIMCSMFGSYGLELCREFGVFGLPSLNWGNNGVDSEHLIMPH